MHLPSTLLSVATLSTLAAGAGILHKKADISSVPPSAWSTLNNTVSGKLGALYPMGAFCYAQYEGSLNTHVNLAQCAALQASQTITTYQAQFPQGYSYSTWPMCIAKSQSCNTQGLLPADPVTPLVGNCRQGSVPNYYVDARSDSDIKATLAFAKKYSISLVIKASGHDYKGRSAGQGALMLWVYNYRPAMQLQKSFVPAGASSPVGDVITFAAGHDMEAVLGFADQNGGAVISGTAKSLHPAGGFLQGGGHSPLSPSWGLAVDDTHEIKAILADGTSVTASRSQNQDVFFALAGGGPSTFGVVTQVSMLLHPNPEQGYQFAEFAMVGLTDQSASQLLKVLIANAEQWAKDGWGGYAFPGLASNHTNLVVLVNPKMSNADAQKSLAPLTAFMATLPSGNVALNQIMSHKGYKEVWDSLTNGDVALQGGGVSLSSRIVPVDNFRGAANQQNLFNAIYPIVNAFGSTTREPLFMCLTAPYQYAAKSSSVTPAWYKGLWHVIALNEWNPQSSTSDIKGQFKKSHDVIQHLVALTPGSGAYQNEADTLETDPVGAYWGQANYNRLWSIKKTVDPTSLLTVWQGVGWNNADSRWSCYPN